MDSGGDFVRGRAGATGAAPQGAAPAGGKNPDADFLFSRSRKSSKKRKQSKDARGARGAPSRGSAGRAAKKQRQGEMQAAGGVEEVRTPSQRASVVMESISFKNLRVGVKLLAVVRKVTRNDAVLSLPNGLTAYLAKQDASDYFHGMDRESLDQVDLRTTSARRSTSPAS